MEITAPKLRQLFAYWEARSHSPYPRRAEFRPSELRFILGGMSLIEIQWEPLRFLYRLHGADMASWAGFDLTGKFLEQCPNRNWAARAAEHLSEVAITGVPSAAWYADEIIGGQCWNVEALTLPISRDGANLDMLISAIDYHPGARRADSAGHRRAAPPPHPLPRHPPPAPGFVGRAL